MRRMAGIERSRVVYTGAATGTRISGEVTRRTVSLPRAAKAAEKAHGPS